MVAEKETYQQATIHTRDELRTIAHSRLVRDLSSLSLPEVDDLVDRISRNIPAGNVPGMILNGLMRIGGRQAPPPEQVQQHIHLLFKGMEKLKDAALYGAIFGAPAMILHGYQGLLQLRGLDPEKAFPNGTWQFYVDYALRDDLARHANETDGFDTTLRQHQLTLSHVDRLTAWVMAAVYTLHQYEALLANEWRERTHTRILRELTQELPNAQATADCYRRWEKVRPYGRGTDVEPTADYPSYRRQKFDAFMAQAIAPLDPHIQQAWRTQIGQAEQDELANYQAQLSIRAYLNPQAYVENHVPIPLSKAYIGLIVNNQYYCIPACQSHTELPAHVQTVRGQIAALLTHPASQPPALLAPLAQVRRTALPALIEKLDATVQEGLHLLRAAPILINADQRPPELPLAQIRRAERGIGDHALTIFDTGQSFVFDQSHIFFDGAWGAALAEMMTNEALAWGVYLHTLPTAVPHVAPPKAPLLHLDTAASVKISHAPQVTAEASAESTAVDLKNILRLRQLFKQRSGLLKLTVNDLLILYRAIHAMRYQPSPALLAELKQLAKVNELQPAATAALSALAESGRANPATLIPIDASQRSPRERLHPMTFEVPLAELDLLNLHQQTVAALAEGDHAKFSELRRTYLGTLAGFGELFSRVKKIGMEGNSNSVQTMKLLANIPLFLQNLLRSIPDRIDVLNDLIKGREVFSNVGSVVPSSSLRRFITAKDDNEKKMLCWGVMTNAEGVMVITLRDFRPHVGLLKKQHQTDLAQRLTQDYLDSYVHGLNTYVREVKNIALNR